MSRSTRLAVAFVFFSVISLGFCAYLLSPHFEEGAILARGVSITRGERGIELSVDYNSDAAVGGAPQTIGGITACDDLDSYAVVSENYVVGSYLKSSRRMWFLYDTASRSPDRSVVELASESEMREALRTLGVDPSFKLQSPEVALKQQRRRDERVWMLLGVGVFLLIGSVVIWVMSPCRIAAGVE